MTYKIELEQPEVMLILHALGELKLKVSAATFFKVQQQVAKQDEANAIEVKP